MLYPFIKNKTSRLFPQGKSPSQPRTLGQVYKYHVWVPSCGSVLTSNHKTVGYPLHPIIFMPLFHSWALWFTGFTTVDDLSSHSGLHSTFQLLWKLASREKVSSQYWGLTIKFWWVTKASDNSLYCLGRGLGSPCSATPREVTHTRDWTFCLINLTASGKNMIISLNFNPGCI